MRSCLHSFHGGAGVLLAGLGLRGWRDSNGRFVGVQGRLHLLRGSKKDSQVYCAQCA